MKRGGVLGGKPIEPAPGAKAFYFRVTSFNEKGERRHFDTAILNYPTLAEAANGCTRAYPNAKIFALNETEFDSDGLPKVKIRAHSNYDA